MLAVYEIMKQFKLIEFYIVLNCVNVILCVCVAANFVAVQ